MCDTNLNESNRKSRRLMDDIKNSKFKYSELSMYLIHMEASRSSRRLIFKRPELLEVNTRLSSKYPSVHASYIPPFITASIPKNLLDFVNQYNYVVDAVKVEWFYGGLYHYEINNPYRSQVHYHRYSDRTLYSKVADTCGFSDYKIAFKSWMESVDNPGSIIVYSGIAYIKDIKSARMRTMKVMSHVLDYQHVITVTILQ